MYADLYGESVVHRVRYDDRTVAMSTYEVGIVARLADGKAIPTAGVMTAQFVQRLADENLDPATLVTAIRRDGIEIPIFAVMDDLALMQSSAFHCTVETILTQNLDCWIEMDRNPLS